MKTTISNRIKKGLRIVMLLALVGMFVSRFTATANEELGVSVVNVIALSDEQQGRLVQGTPKAVTGSQRVIYAYRIKNDSICAEKGTCKLPTQLLPNTGSENTVLLTTVFSLVAVGAGAILVKSNKAQRMMALFIVGGVGAYAVASTPVSATTDLPAAVQQYFEQMANNRECPIPVDCFEYVGYVIKESTTTEVTTQEVTAEATTVEVTTEAVTVTPTTEVTTEATTMLPETELPVTILTTEETSRAQANQL